MLPPKVRIEIEEEFDKFIASFRGGQRVDHIIDCIPHGVLNADYFFPEDNVIAELKCLFSDAADISTYGKRLVACYRHFGYTEGEIGSQMMGMKPVPDKIRQRMLSMASRPVVEAIKKANKQIRSTKSLLKAEDAKGLVLVANDNNYGFSPEIAMTVICKAFSQIEKLHIDGIVYLTPNVDHDDGTDILKSYWIPVYNVGSEKFSEFVNPLGKGWIDYLEDLQGPYTERGEQKRPSSHDLSSMPVRLSPEHFTQAAPEDGAESRD